MSANLKHKHLHIYERSTGNKEIYRCISPDCNSFTRREFLIGKRAICAKDKVNEFIIPAEQLRAGQKREGNKQLVCELCTKSLKRDIKLLALKATESILDEIYKEEAEEKFKIGDGI